MTIEPGTIIRIERRVSRTWGAADEHGNPLPVYTDTEYGVYVQTVGASTLYLCEWEKPMLLSTQAKIWPARLDEEREQKLKHNFALWKMGALNLEAART